MLTLNLNNTDFGKKKKKKLIFTSKLKTEVFFLLLISVFMFILSRNSHIKGHLSTVTNNINTNLRTTNNEVRLAPKQTNTTNSIGI